jgi:hypothetical protein
LVRAIVAPNENRILDTRQSAEERPIRNFAFGDETGRFSRGKDQYVAPGDMIGDDHARFRAQWLALEAEAQPQQGAGRPSKKGRNQPGQTPTAAARQALQRDTYEVKSCQGQEQKKCADI